MGPGFVKSDFDLPLSWKPLNALGFDLGSPTSFDRIIQSHEDGTTLGKGVDQHTQQNSARLQARPFRTIQNTTVIRKMFLHTETHHTQGRCHGSLGRSKDRPDQQDLRMLPNPLREQARERSEDRDIFVLQGRYRLPLVREFALAYPAFH